MVTQNIDGLHQKAGSKTVFELHGSVLRNFCTKCGKAYRADFIKQGTGLPLCSCGGLIKPDVVLYEEGLDDATVAGAIEAIAGAQLMIVAGTSLTVYPAAGLLRYFGGSIWCRSTAPPHSLTKPPTCSSAGSVGETLAQIRL